MSASALELNHLIAEIINHAVDLLDHRLREDLHFNADFDRSDWASGNQIAGVSASGLSWNNLAKGPISAPGRHAASFILDIEYAIPSIDRSLDQFGRAIDGDQIFIQMHRDVVALVRRAVLVNLAFKQSPELRGGAGIRVVRGAPANITSASVAPTTRCCRAAFAIRCRAISTYAGSISLAIEFLPDIIAACDVEPVPANGSKTVSPAKENILIRRSAISTGNGAGCPSRVEAPRMSAQIDRNQVFISSRVSIESAF